MTEHSPRRKSSRKKNSGQRPRRSRKASTPGPARRRRSGGRKPRSLLRALALLSLLVGAGLGPLIVWSFLPASEPRAEPMEFRVEEESRGSVIDRLADRGYIRRAGLMKTYSALLAPGLNFPPRTHLLRWGLSPRELLQRLGEARRPAVKVTFPEGFNQFSMAARLQERGVCGQNAFLEAASSPALLEELGVSAQSAEGYLFPSTYEFREDERPEKVARKMVREGLLRLDAELTAVGGLPEELVRLGIGPHEVLVLASIVEKETAVASERPRIARVFLNRLGDRGGVTSGRLQSDPTASYGCQLLGADAPPSCGGEGSAPTPEMLRDAANPYNTYRHAGLPPGPICSPGADAVRAVLSAPPSPEMFFVADGQGSHTFSETYAEHRKAIQKLRKIRP